MNGNGIVSPYLPVRAELEAVLEETPNVKTFRIRPERPLRFDAGQFVDLTVPGVGEAPFTPSSSPRVADTLEITIMRVGKVTEALHRLAPGAELWVRGPLGEAYPLDRMRGREVLIAGGGCGVGPLRALIYVILDEIDRYPRVILRYGARTPDDVVFKEALRDEWEGRVDLDVLLTVDRAAEGWPGHVGVLPRILEPDRLNCDPSNGVAIVCGPPLMMKYTTLKLLERGYAPGDIYLSMERNMSCGIGKCGHCRLGRWYVCRDGPVLTYAQVEPYAARPYLKLWEH
jgi:NAD(P)H-flavin reductase